MTNIYLKNFQTKERLTIAIDEFGEKYTELPDGRTATFARREGPDRIWLVDGEEFHQV